MHPITTTEAIDPVFMFIFGACLVLLIGITAAMVTFVVRYHRSRSPEPTSRVENNLRLEVVWTLLPTLLVLAMFYYGWAGYLALRNVPEGAMEVTATARMWSWSFSYANGRTATKLYVPVGKPVKVELVSPDVVHGFYVPAFRVKRDVVPGMKNHVWFVADKAGSYDLFCSQYCGTGHSAMITTIEALPAPEFAAWLQQETAGAAGNGRTLMEKHGCVGCHSLDGSPSIGPTLKGLFGSQVKVTKDGKPLTVTADRAFLIESIREPMATVVEGFQPIMPANPDLSKEDLEAIVEFIKELK
ncbi:cytochrome c oxidase subunit II [Geobacter sp. SVR]|uniref:cytochrome c oxidase subunit II n=1 Tax=Geobacter sp. SVR TaxID=2495594 RepID=UPI001565B80C|nr:cytochrome c oxidase subunit II [Geobacter sp. SVR]